MQEEGEGGNQTDSRKGWEDWKTGATRIVEVKEQKDEQ